MVGDMRRTRMAKKSRPLAPPDKSLAPNNKRTQQYAYKNTQGNPRRHGLRVTVSATATRKQCNNRSQAGAAVRRLTKSNRQTHSESDFDASPLYR
jgi:hypothetical protein